MAQSTTQPKIIKWIAGNKLRLALPMEMVLITEEGKTEEPYVPPTGSDIVVCLKSGRREIRYTPQIVDNSTLTFEDNGMLPVGKYLIEILVREPDETRRRSAWPDVLEIYPNNTEVLDEYEDFPDYPIEGEIIETSVFYFAKGDKGDPFTYEDFTEAQLADLRRPATEAAAQALATDALVSEHETERQTAEGNRAFFENQRQEAESARQTNELARQTNERQRQTNTAAAIIATNQAAQSATTAAATANAAAENASHTPYIGNDYYVYVWDSGQQQYTRTNIYLKGADGITPHIDRPTGNWFVGDINTGVHAQGEQGDPFTIYNTYASLESMYLDRDNVPIDAFVMIASTVDDPDNAKLFVRDDHTRTGFTFVCDLSGAQGEQGQQGPAGVGVPTGGTTGQVLKKRSDSNYDTEWGDGGSGGDQIQSDWNQSDNTKVDYIKNKPTIPAAQIQSDWNQNSSSAVDYIKNKPTIPDISGKADKATTLAGYGITDAKIVSGVITLGSDTITPLTSHQDISGKADKVGSATSGDFAALDSNGNLTDSGHKHSDYQTALSTQTAYTSKGSATKVPQITTNTLGQVTGITEVTITQPDISSCILKSNTAGLVKNDGTIDTNTYLTSAPVTSVNGQTGAVILNIPDVSTKEDKVDIVSASGATLTAEVSKYYTLSNVGTLAITLPTIASGTTKVQTVTFYIAAGSTPAVTFTSTHSIYYADGFEIAADSTYEVNALWNGAAWIVLSVKIVIPT